MAKDSRYGPMVRERTKLLAALMRTPDDGLLTFAQAHELSHELDVTQLRRIRELLDALSEGMLADATDPFWERVDLALKRLQGEGEAPAAPLPPPPAAVLSAPVRPAAPDFRHNVMENNPGLPKPAPPGKRGRGWKPSNPKVRPPIPDQEETALLETGKEGTLKIAAVTTTRSWPLKKVARLEAAYATHKERGDPTIEDICQFFDLPTERAIRVALSTWQRRIEADDDLAAEHAELLKKLKREDGD